METCQITVSGFIFLECSHEKHTQTLTLPYLSDLGVSATAVSRCGVHPPPTFGQLQRHVGVPSARTLLPQGALLILDTPTAFKPGVSLQAHPTAVP